VKKFAQFVNDLGTYATQRKQRQLVMICGEQTWAIELLGQTLALETCLWLGQGMDSVGVPMSKTSSVLGREYKSLVFNAYSGFNPDAFGQCVGTLAGGGLCFIIAPPLSAWADYDDPDYLRYLASPAQQGQNNNYFITRLIGLIEQDQRCVVVDQRFELPPIPSGAKLTDEITNLFAEQEQAVTQIIKTVTGHRRRPLVITADRGRGKSSALGIAAAQLLKSKLTDITVTAPKGAALESLFKHAMLSLDGAMLDKYVLHWQGKTIRFLPPDELVQQLPDCELLLVDEAAAIPTPMLTQLAKHYSRIVFSTTVHGYEGTGRGFALRFLKTLTTLSPDWRACELVQPIRWAGDDPLEQLSNAMLGLDAKAVNLNSSLGVIQPNQLSLVELSQRQLLDDSALLAQVFGLLVLAHYQTKPSDFRQLLDAPQLTVFAALNDNKVVAVALVLQEGQLNERLCQEIAQGKRRLRGHLLPQSLLAQVGLAGAGNKRYARIMRIAVHPQLQQGGIGLALERFIVGWAQQQGLDYIGASFGATASLTQFWLTCGYTPLRVGLTKDQASGTHSLLVLKSLRQQGVESDFIVCARSMFAGALRYSLASDFSALEPNLVMLLLNSLPAVGELNVVEESNVANYIQSDRPLEQIDYLLEKLIWQQPQRLTNLDDRQRQVVIRKVLQRHDWSQLAMNLDFTGKKQVKAQLKQTISEMFGRHKDDGK